MKKEKFIRNCIKELGREKTRLLFTSLATRGNPKSDEEDWVKELGREGLRYLNTGTIKPMHTTTKPENLDDKDWRAPNHVKPKGGLDD